MIVEMEIHSKTQAVLKRLLVGQNELLNQTHKNSKLFRRLGIKL
jgi:hypothetical protein